jgi:hypothetical protein
MVSPELAVSLCAYSPSSSHISASAAPSIDLKLR